MTFVLSAILSLFSLGVAVTIASIRLRKIDQKYFPFIAFIWVGFVNEIQSVILVSNGFPNGITSNFYYLLETIIIFWQFKKWGLLNNKPAYWVLQVSFIVFWLYESFIFSSIKSFNSYFIVAHSFVIVLLSISVINRLLINERSSLLKNSIFIISIGFILFFTYSMLVEIFWLYGINSSKTFRIGVYNILVYLNFFVNLIYALAILWIPRKKEYILQS